MVIISTEQSITDFCLFLVAICCNTLKSSCKEKQSEILHSCFYRWLNQNTEKWDIGHSDFKILTFFIGPLQQIF